MRDRFVPMIRKSRLVAVVLALAISGTATSVVFAKTTSGSANGQSASYSEYGCPPGHSGSKCNTTEKPGCGNEQNIGISGNSGAHGGQPPKAEERGDCPHDPGVDGDDGP